MNVLGFLIATNEGIPNAVAVDIITIWSSTVLSRWIYVILLNFNLCLLDNAKVR